MRNVNWIVSGLCAGFLFSAGAAMAQGSEPGFAYQASPSQPEKSRAKSDRDFLQEALGVNELELRLGHLAGERAATPEVKALGQKMVQKHGELGQQLSKLARESGGSGEPALSADQQATLDSVASQPGVAFDTVFKQTVDAGHVRELEMYREEASSAVNPQLRELAKIRTVKLHEAVANSWAAATGPTWPRTARGSGDSRRLEREAKGLRAGQGFFGRRRHHHRVAHLPAPFGV